MLHWYTFWKHMRTISNKDIEKRAVMELIIFCEGIINQIILQSVKELDKINQAKRIQGLYQKKRIDQICVKNAIKHLCEEGHPLNRRKVGGKQNR
jgi:hypothetical protein